MSNEAFSRVLIDKALGFSGWNLLDPHQLRFALNGSLGRADYVLSGQRGPLCVPMQKESAAHAAEIRAMEAEQATSHRRLDDLFQSLLHRAFMENCEPWVEKPERDGVPRPRSSTPSTPSFHLFALDGRGGRR